MARDKLAEALLLNKEYEKQRKRFERAIRAVESVLKDFFEDINAESVHYITCRVKTKDSILRKLKQKEYKTIFNDMKDIAGMRIVCHNESDVEEIVNFIRQQYAILEDEKIDRKDGYKARHLVINVKTPVAGIFRDTKVEIQIRTIAQDLFATLSHRDIYKLSVALPESWITKMKTLSDKLEEVDKLAQDLKYEWIEENSEKRMKDQLSVQTIVRFCKSKLNEELSIALSTEILISLINLEIRKISQLESMLSDDKIRNTLSKIYLEFLEREPNISELCFYGALLYKFGITDFSLKIITSGIKATAEYNSKHGSVLGRRLPGLSSVSNHADFYTQEKNK